MSRLLGARRRRLARRSPALLTTAPNRSGRIAPMAPVRIMGGGGASLSSAAPRSSTISIAITPGGGRLSESSSDSSSEEKRCHLPSEGRASARARARYFTREHACRRGRAKRSRVGGLVSPETAALRVSSGFGPGASSAAEGSSATRRIQSGSADSGIAVNAFAWAESGSSDGCGG